ncbi:MAG: DNA repair protein RecN [Elusimicrobia bacterium]|nr:DNA repair protein RecN [Elusimicrobiota bacterium]
MLVEVAVKNFALLEDLRLELGPGLVALTGETGAGKSLLLDALGLALGRRAETAQIRRGAERLSVSARFQGLGRRLKTLLKEIGLGEEKDEELVLRREVDAAGKSRAFANDHPVNLATLGRLGELLVSAHGQSDQQLLLKPAEQRDLLDSFGGLEEVRRSVERSHAGWRECAAERDALTLSEQERAQRLDLYRFQKRELEAANVRPEEEAELETLLPQLKNADRLKSLAQEAHGFLHAQESSATDLARRVQREVESLKALGAPLAEVSDLLDTAVVNMEEAAQQLEGFFVGIDADPARLEEVLSRLDLLGKLKRKYGPTLADVAAYRARVSEELDRLDHLEGKSADIARRLAEAEAELARQSAVLSEGRRKAAKRLTTAVQKDFKEVGLPHAAFVVDVQSEEGRFTSTGADQVQFFFAANPGEGQAPLAETASGGELSRVMLAIESVFARADNVPVLIFDEIDAGVGGSLGGVLGKKLAALGRGRQVLCVTHLATIAACADAHWTVEKEIKGDRTRANLRRLTEAERPAEIARLFGSAPGADTSLGLRHAKDLLATSRYESI